MVNSGLDWKDAHLVVQGAIFEWCQILMDSVEVVNIDPNPDCLLHDLQLAHVLMQLLHCLLIGYNRSNKKQ